MVESLAAVVLAAGAGERLRPLTWLRPKPLCPVGGITLLDHALARVLAVLPAGSIAVNAHHHRDQLLDHLAAHHPDVHVSVEEARPLGTAGALGYLRPWIDGRAVLVVNGDTWSEPDVGAFVAAWDGARVRILVVGSEPFGPRSRVVASLHPPAVAASLGSHPSGLYEVCWQGAARRGALESVPYAGPFVDCATPADYLRANLEASGGTSVIGDGAIVEGTVERCVLWPGAVVGGREHLVDAIRTGDGPRAVGGRPVTVLVR